MTTWAKLADAVWDQVLSSTVSTPVYLTAEDEHKANLEKVMALDARIDHHITVTLTSVLFLSTDLPPQSNRLQEHCLAHNHFAQLRLLLYRRTLLSPEYDQRTGTLCGNVAVGIVQRVNAHSAQIRTPSSFRFHLVISLGHAIFTLCAVILRSNPPLDGVSEDSSRRVNFILARNLLQAASENCEFASNLFLDLENLIQMTHNLTIGSLESPDEDHIYHTLCDWELKPIIPWSERDYNAKTKFSNYSGYEKGSDDVWELEFWERRTPACFLWM